MFFGVTTDVNKRQFVSCARKIVNSLKSKGTDIVVEESLAKKLGLKGKSIKDMDVDMLICVGDDGVILKTLLELRDKQIPLLGVRTPGNLGFLAETSTTNFDSYIDNILEGNWKVEERSRIEAEIDGEKTSPALNEIAIFAKRSATLIHYTLKINEEFMWRDSADGVIVSTPSGSTAYALSAGGPIVTYDAPVLVVVPVNSLNQARRPLVVSDSREIIIDEIESPVTCEIILDGRIRENIEEKTVKIRKSKYGALFVKLSEGVFTPLKEKLYMKVRQWEEKESLPPSAKLVLKVLEYEGPMTQKEIAEKTLLPRRTVRNALKILLQKELIVKKTTLRDARLSIYHIKGFDEE